MKMKNDQTRHFGAAKSKKFQQYLPMSHETGFQVQAYSYQGSVKAYSAYRALLLTGIKRSRETI